ncbi:MAG: FAD-dependent oxidoreductase [Planctomycetota bacterium]
MTEHLLGSSSRPLRIAVVGSGPSAFYAVDALFRAENLTCRVDMFDRLATPYGLVRGGVAPDHQKIKSVVRIYEGIAADPRMRFFGNVKVGSDLSVRDLEALYDRVIWAVGAESDRQLGIDGEDLQGVFSATEFVGWYNAHPDHAKKDFGLDRVRRAVVIGNGNVAMDVARVLVRSRDELARSDIAENALEALRASPIEAVDVLGRRGPIQAAFSPKELKEVGKLAGVKVVVNGEHLQFDEAAKAELEEAGRSAQKNIDQLREFAEEPERPDDRPVRFRFLRSPKALIDNGSGRVGRVVVERNQLQKDPESGALKARGSGETFEIEADLVLRAVGYRGVPIPGLPFDDWTGTIPNEEGRVLESVGGAVLPNHYVVGWAKRGPSGLIGTNSPDSKAVAAELIADLNGVSAAGLPDGEADRLPALLAEREVRAVSFEDWQAYDAWEVETGQAAGCVRRKLADTDEILAQIERLRTGG